VKTKNKERSKKCLSAPTEKVVCLITIQDVFSEMMKHQTRSFIKNLAL